MPPVLLPARRSLLLLGAVGLTAGVGLAHVAESPRIPDPADPRTTLDAVESAIARLLGVPEIGPDGLARLMASGVPLVLLDMRTPEEHAWSRLPGALRVDPQAAPEDVLARHGARFAGATAVLHCAVGWRSGVMAAGIARAAGTGGAAALLNLRGGLFRWHAQGRPLEPAGAEVHPYDAGWGRLLARTVAASDSPAGLPQADAAAFRDQS